MRYYKDKYFWLIFPFLEPLVFKSYMTWVDSIFSLLKVVALFVLLRVYVRLRPSKYILLVFLYEFGLFLSSLLSDSGSIVRYCGPAVSVLGTCLYVEYMFKTNRSFIAMKYMSSILMVSCVINFFTIILFPEGFEEGSASAHGYWVFFLGIDNRLVFTFLPLTVISAIYSKISENRIGKGVYLITIINLMALLSFWSVGGMLAMVMITFFLIFWKSIPVRLVNSWTCYMTVLVANILLVFVRIQNNYESFIENTLDKDVTLTGRTFLWDYGLLQFIKHPVLGSGFIRLDDLPVEMLGVAHMHNLFMNVLFYGGLIGLFLFLLIQNCWVSSLYKFRKTFAGTMLNLSLFTALMMSLADTFDTATYWILITMSVNVKYLLCENEKNIFSYHNL